MAAFYDEFKYYKESRADLENQIWPACDEAYMCIRSLPENEGMDWVMKDWDLGETDIWDGVNFLADYISVWSRAVPKLSTSLLSQLFKWEQEMMWDRDYENRIRRQTLRVFDFVRVDKNGRVFCDDAVILPVFDGSLADREMLNRIYYNIPEQEQE